MPRRKPEILSTHGKGFIPLKIFVHAFLGLIFTSNNMPKKWRFVTNTFRAWTTLEMTNWSYTWCSFRKKLGIAASNDDWDTASNHIAKRYMDDVSTARYFDDVMMQMTTKLWAARYNYHKPPKKVLSLPPWLLLNVLRLLLFQVDIIQMSVLEFVNRHERSHYHLESFIVSDSIRATLFCVFSLANYSHQKRSFYRKTISGGDVYQIQFE